MQTLCYISSKCSKSACTKRNETSRMSTRAFQVVFCGTVEPPMVVYISKNIYGNGGSTVAESDYSDLGWFEYEFILGMVLKMFTTLC